MKLSQPSKKLKKRILNEISFEDRIVGYRMRPRTGPSPVSLYSFKEVFILLNDQHPRIDFHMLRLWIKDVMLDRELSENIGKIIEAEDVSDHLKSGRIRDVMGQRLAQCM